jgi:hypothetical protein
MKNIIILSIFVSLLTASCKNGVVKDEIMEQANEFYQETLRQVQIDLPKEFIDFFPSQMEVSGKTGGSSNAEYNRCLSFFLFEYDRKNRIDSLEHVFSKKSIASYQSTDTNTIVVKRWEIRQEQKDEVLYKDSVYGGKIYYPIPYFEKEEPVRIGNASSPTNIYSDSTRCGLSGDYTIYVLDSNPGLYNWDLRPLFYMPDGWKNGYSKGVCINNKDGIIVYWVLVW